MHNLTFILIQADCQIQLSTIMNSSTWMQTNYLKPRLKQSTNTSRICLLNFHRSHHSCWTPCFKPRYVRLNYRCRNLTLMQHVRTYVCIHTNKSRTHKAFLIYIIHFPVHCVLKSISWQFIAESECYNVHIHLRTSCGAYVRTYMCNFPTITNYQSCMPLYVRTYARCWFDIHKNSILHTAYGQQL